MTAHKANCLSAGAPANAAKMADTEGDLKIVAAREGVALGALFGGHGGKPAERPHPDREVGLLLIAVSHPVRQIRRAPVAVLQLPFLAYMSPAVSHRNCGVLRISKVDLLLTATVGFP